VTKKEADIIVVLETVEKCYKEYSTEYQWQLTCELYEQEFQEKIDHSDIANALWAKALQENLERQTQKEESK